MAEEQPKRPKIDIQKYLDDARELTAEQRVTEVGMLLLKSGLGVLGEHDLLALISYHYGMAMREMLGRISALEERMNSDPRGE